MRLWQHLKAHLRVFGIAIVFGLGAYALVIVFTNAARLVGFGP